MKDVIYLYGMKSKDYDPEGYPKLGFIDAQDDVLGEYESILVYDRVLSQKEENRFALDYIGSRMRR